MFCTSLPKRPEWSSVPINLLSSNYLRWQEKKLETHDIAIPIPTPQQQQSFFRLLLLSATDLVRLDEAMTRIEKLQHQEGDKQCGILFLLQEKNSEGNGTGTVNGTTAFIDLQISLQDGGFEMLLFPLHALGALPSTIVELQRSILSSRRHGPPPSHSVHSLLPFCSVAPPVPERSVNLLSDLCPSILALAQAATTYEGQAVLRDAVPEGEQQVAEDVIEFWGVEIIAD